MQDCRVIRSEASSEHDNDIGFGYCGKVYDIGTGLYDYGFRDYSPNNARFTTVDPIRDGSNWFSYVVNDPVNYVDPLGLSTSDRSSSPNFNTGMFGQNIGFNGFTVNTQTGNNSQSSISPFGSYFSATTITGYKLDLGGAKPKTTGLMNLGNIIHETGISFADNTIGTSDGLNYFINDTPYYYVILPENPIPADKFFYEFTEEQRNKEINRMIVEPFSQSNAGLGIDAAINARTEQVRKISTGGVCRAYQDVIDNNVVLLYEASNDSVGSLGVLLGHSKPGIYSKDKNGNYPKDIQNWFSQYPYLWLVLEEANRRASGE